MRGRQARIDCPLSRADGVCVANTGAVLLEQVVAASASGEPDQVQIEVELPRDGVTAVPAAGFTLIAHAEGGRPRAFQ